MKKFLILSIFTLCVASCGNKQAACVENTCDSCAVDSCVVDSCVVDSCVVDSVIDCDC